MRSPHRAGGGNPAGIGAAIAGRLAAEGHRVVVLDRDVDAAGATPRSIDPSGTAAVAVGVDVADEQSVNEAVATGVDALGPPTIMVNCAGFARDRLIDDMPTADWHAVVGVHLRGAFLTTRAVAPYLRSSTSSRRASSSAT